MKSVYHNYSHLRILIVVVLVISIFGTACHTQNTETENTSNSTQTDETELTSNSKQTEETKLTTDSINSEETNKSSTHTISDALGREIEVPTQINSIVCVGVGALRYTTYMQAQDLVIGVEEYETEPSIKRLYNFTNSEYFTSLPIIGGNGEPNAEQMITLNPDVIVMSAFAPIEADDLQTKTQIPVFVIPGSDKTLDDQAYATIELLGELLQKQERATELTNYFNEVKADLQNRIEIIKEEDKPSIYVAGVSFKGHHGFEGTEAGYGPLELLQARNLADEVDQTGPFNMDVEQVLVWDPDIIFVDYNGLPIIEEDVAKNKSFYENLTAVKEDKVYAQIPFRDFASNLEMALVNTYYAGTVIYPNEFSDIDMPQKQTEIFEMLLGKDSSQDLTDAGYLFEQIDLLP